MEGLGVYNEGVCVSGTRLTENIRNTQGSTFGGGRCHLSQSLLDEAGKVMVFILPTKKRRGGDLSKATQLGSAEGKMQTGQMDSGPMLFLPGRDNQA